MTKGVVKHDALEERKSVAWRPRANEGGREEERERPEIAG
jgi:hypothetical protein